MTMDVERTALKEWAVLVDAMARGDIIAMVRKGGIREQRAGFLVRHDRFLLYPTYFHENPSHLAVRFHPMLEMSHARRPPPGVIRIEHVAEVLAVWNITDPSLLPLVAHEHGLAPAAVESRFHYRGRPNVRLVAVRTLALPTPVEMPEVSRYAGCVSWLELDAGVAIDGACATVEQEALRRRIDRLHAVLGEPEREPS
jgi:hypothetical protein